MTRALGIIHMVISGLLMLSWLVGAAALWLYGGPDEGEALVALVIAFVVIGLCFMIPSFVGGWGLVRGKQWARGLIMVLSIILLFLFPIGTLLGGFGLWVLFTDTPDPPIPIGTQSPGSRSNAPSSSA